MSGVNWPVEHGPPADETPRALAELRASLGDASPSPGVERELETAWRALHDTRPTSATPGRGWSTALGSAAAVLAVLLGAWLLQPRDLSAPQTSSVARGTAVPDSPLVPPPREPAGPLRPPPKGGEAAAPGDQRATSDAGLVPSTPSAGRSAPSPPGSGRANGRRPAPTAALSASRDEPEPFEWLRGADDVEPGLGLEIVRVHVPRVLWDVSGPRRVLLEADLLMGHDGQPRAIRLARAGEQEQ